MLKYLIVGDANSMHIFNYVKNILDRNKFEVSLLTLSTERVRKEYREYYQENNIILYSIAEKFGGDLPNKTKKQRLFNFIKKYLLAKKLPKFDICHFHSVYKTSILFYLLNKKKFKYLIASYWGGDIEDVTPFVVKLRKKCFKKANVITVTTQKTYEDFKNIYGNMFDEKLKICRFATAGIECIRTVFDRVGTGGCKDLMKFPKDKLCITVGYSAYEDQHQDWIISKIATLSKEIKDRIFISVPMQYGRYNQPYIDRVHKEVQNCGCEYALLEEYASFEKKAAEAIATDVYIHMRDTDAFSNSLKEQVYAGSCVIIGKWLKYYELEQIKADVVWVDHFDCIPKVISECLRNTKKTTLFEPIYKMYSFEAVARQWNEVIDFALGEENK